MPVKKDRNISLPKEGMMEGISLRIKLILRLMADRRVSIFLKALPVATLAYLLIPDLVIGPIDDVVIIWLGTYLFVELCPPEVVEEHMKALHQVLPGEWRDPTAGEGDDQVYQSNPGSSEDEVVIDVPFWEKKDE
jgi:hypothetical protein